MNGNEPIQAASETEAPRKSHSKAACIRRFGPRNKLRGKKGSGAPQRCKNPKRGSANNMIAPTTANESWKPVEKSSFVSQQRRKKAAAARLLSTKTLRSKRSHRAKSKPSRQRAHSKRAVRLLPRKKRVTE